MRRSFVLTRGASATDDTSIVGPSRLTLKHAGDLETKLLPTPVPIVLITRGSPPMMLDLPLAVGCGIDGHHPSYSLMHTEC